MINNDFLGYELCKAAMCGDMNKVIEYIEQDISIINYQDSIAKYTPLHCAFGNGYPNIGLYLLNQGANPNLCNSTGRTPLHFAARIGHLESGRVLIKNKADINAQDVYGQSALHISNRIGHINFSNLLMMNSINKDLVDIYGHNAFDMVSIND